MFNFIENLRNKLRNYHENWLNRSSKQKYLHIFNVAKYMCNLLGIRVLSDLKYNWRTPIGGVIALDVFSSVFYTIYYHCKQGQYLKSSECLAPVGGLIVVSTECLFK